MKVWGVQRDPCLPPTGFTQLLVTYVHGAFPHLFASQAEAGKDMLKRKRSQERFAKADCSSCFPTSSWQQQLRGGGGGGGGAEGEAKPADNRLPSHSHEGI